MANPWDGDTEFSDHRIIEVSKEGDLTRVKFETSAMVFYCPFEVYPGQTARIFGKGPGHPVRGIVIDGVMAQYMSVKEFEAEVERQRQKSEAIKEEIRKLPPRPEITMHGRTYSHEMGEISGMRGGHEKCLRAMVLAGVEFLSTYKGDFPEVGTFEGVHGIHINGNESAELLEKAIIAAEYELDGEIRSVRDDHSGAQLQHAMVHSCVAHKLGWEAYCDTMIEIHQDRIKKDPDQ